MSLTSKQIDELRAYAKGRKGELAKLINDAADTIEMLSAKLHASQMERSSQYYHGGWIPVSEKLPEKPFGCLVTVWDTNPITMDEFENILPYFVGWDGEQWNDCDGEQCPFEVIAWMPLPSTYREEGEK